MPEVVEIPKETVNSKVDSQVDSGSISKLEQQLKADAIKEHWKQIATFLGPYRSTINPEEIQTQYIPGEMGKGTLSDDSSRRLTIEMPDELEAVRSLQSGLKSAGVDLTTDEATSLLYTLQAQTALHEGTHALMDSRPGSQLAQDVEKAGLPNEHGYDSTLLDEGITYASQNYFAPVSEKLGKLTVRPHTVEELKAETDPKKQMTLRRKILGNKLTPLVKEYLDQNRLVDEEFMQRAITSLREIEDVA